MDIAARTANPILTRYFADIRDLPPLDRDREVELAARVREGCDDAVDALVRANLAFVAHVAGEFRGSGVALEDLLNEGNIGLIEAARRYDPSRGTRFLTYAVWWIRKAILRAVVEQSGVVRVPGYQRKRLRRIREAESALRASLGRRPQRDEISGRLSESVRRVEHCLAQDVRAVSLDAEPAVGGRPLRERIEDASSPGPEDAMLRREAEGLVQRSLARLTAQEQAVLRHRFGLTGEPPLTLNEAGARLGISRERVRQIEVAAKKRMRRLLLRSYRPVTAAEAAAS